MDSKVYIEVNPLNKYSWVIVFFKPMAPTAECRLSSMQEFDNEDECLQNAMETCKTLGEFLVKNNSLQKF
jgi:hypothetical protein